MGIENFERFYEVVKEELELYNLEVDSRSLRGHLRNLDSHGKNIGEEDYHTLAEVFTEGIRYKIGMDIRRKSGD